MAAIYLCQYLVVFVLIYFECALRSKVALSAKVALMVPG